MALNKGFPPSNTISPSVRIAEKDLSFISTTSGIGACGLIGFASKGPLNRPTLVVSPVDLHTKFGYPHPESGDPYLVYAAEQFLLAGNEVYIVRVGDTNAASASAVATATVDIPTAGGPVQIIGNVSVGSGFSFATDQFFRWRLNNILASKVLVVLADANRPSPNTGLPYTMDDLVASLNSQVVPGIDGIFFDFTDKTPAGTSTSTSEIIVQSYFSYGALASIEMVSVTDSLYGPSSVVGLGTLMTPGVLTGTLDQYPPTSIPAPGVFDFSSFPADSLVLDVVVQGTNNVQIDNVVQSVPIPSAVNTTTDIVNAINNEITLGNIPGGFVASAFGDFVRLTTLAYGRDSAVYVKPISTAAPLLGFFGGSGVGSSPVAVSGSGSTYTAGIVTGDPDNSGLISFTINADSPGIDGNATQVVITTNPANGTFDLDIYSYNNQVEVWGGLSKNPTSLRYVETFINQVSNYIKIVDDTNNAAPPLSSTLANPYTLSGGADGIPSNPTDQDALLIGSQSAGTGLLGLSDPEQINLDLIAIPGHTSTEVALALINFCSVVRGDCFCVIDPPFGLNATEIVQWQNGVSPYNDVRFDSDFAALYWPWVMIRDTFNQIDVWAPPSGSVLATYAQSDTLSAPWFPPAGLNRGQVPGIIDIFTRPTLTERDAMYGYRNAVNPIVEFVGTAGFYLWGQKTLQRLPTALDRVNVRRMMLYVEKQISQQARFLLFEPHTPALRKSFVTMATNVLTAVQNASGITDFFVQCDETLNPPDVIDRNELRARIGIQPTRAVEFIFIEFSINRTGSFAESTLTA